MAYYVAENMSKYLYKQDEERRKIVTFETDIQGLVPQYLDKIMVSHSALQWGEAGEVVSVSGNDIVLSDPLTDLSSGQTIVFRGIDGSVSNFYDITIVDKYNVTVNTLPVWVEKGIFYTIQSAGTAKEFLVLSVRHSGERVEISCVNYTPEIYE